MAKLRGKGTVLQQTISAVLTDVANVTDVDLSGEGTDDFDTTDLSTSVWETKDLTGYAQGGTVKVGLFFDPALAGHVTIVALISTPATCIWKLKYSDAGPSSLTFTSAGVQLDQKIVMKDAVKGTVTLNRTGAPTRA